MLPQYLFRDVTEHYMTEAYDCLGSPSDVCPWDINRGLCDQWAETMQDMLGGETVWLEELDGFFDLFDNGLDCAHCVLFWNNLYYDSQHPHGVKDWRDLDLVKGVRRDEYLNKTVRWW